MVHIRHLAARRSKSCGYAGPDSRIHRAGIRQSLRSASRGVSCYSRRAASPVVEGGPLDALVDFIAAAFPQRRVLGILAEHRSLGERSKEIDVGVIGEEPIQRAAHRGSLGAIEEFERHVTDGPHLQGTALDGVDGRRAGGRSGIILRKPDRMYIFEIAV